MSKKRKACLAIVLYFATAKEPKRRRWEWYLKREEFTSENLLRELKLSEPRDYQNFLRMNNDSFNELLEMISPIITKQDTVMRKAISPTERLATTLRFLATGRSFEDLKFSTAIAPQTISSIILETCEAMITKLQEYFQVNKCCFIILYNTHFIIEKKN